MKTNKNKKLHKNIKSKVENNIKTFFLQDSDGDVETLNVSTLRYILLQIKNLKRYKVFIPYYKSQWSDKIDKFYPVNFIDIFNDGEITLYHNFGELTTEDRSKKDVEDDGKTLLGNLNQYKFGCNSILLTNSFLSFYDAIIATKVIIDYKEKTIKIL